MATQNIGASRPSESKTRLMTIVLLILRIPSSNGSSRSSSSSSSICSRCSGTIVCVILQFNPPKRVQRRTASTENATFMIITATIATATATTTTSGESSGSSRSSSCSSMVCMLLTVRWPTCIQMEGVGCGCTLGLPSCILPNPPIHTTSPPGLTRGEPGGGGGGLGLFTHIHRGVHSCGCLFVVLFLSCCCVCVTCFSCYPAPLLCLGGR